MIVYLMSARHQCKSCVFVTACLYFTQNIILHINCSTVLILIFHFQNTFISLFKTHCKLLMVKAFLDVLTTVSVQIRMEEEKHGVFCSQNHNKKHVSI